MEYIILDLEWNNGYCRQFPRPINEIIEIGALRVDENLNICDSFKQLVTPVLTGKLSGRVKQLTHITNDDVLHNGVSFACAMELFCAWLGDAEQIFITWSDTDLYILAEAYQYTQKSPHIPFMKYYVDAQKYCQSFLGDATNQNQVSLLNAAIKLEIDRDESSLHRALADCVLTAKCFIKCFDSKKIKNYVHICDRRFFQRLLFKPFYLKDYTAVQQILEQDVILCPSCEMQVKRISAFEFANNAFRAVCLCQSCRQKCYATYRFKQQYDRLDTKKRVTIAKEAQAISAKKRTN